MFRGLRARLDGGRTDGWDEATPQPSSQLPRTLESRRPDVG